MLSGTQQKVVRIAVGLESLFTFLRDEATAAIHHEPAGFHRRDAATQQLFTEAPALSVRHAQKTRLHSEIKRQSVRVFQQYLKQSANEYSRMSALFWLHLVEAGGGSSGAQDSTKLAIVVICTICLSPITSVCASSW